MECSPSQEMCHFFLSRVFFFSPKTLLSIKVEADILKGDFRLLTKFLGSSLARAFVFPESFALQGHAELGRITPGRLCSFTILRRSHHHSVLQSLPRGD